MEPTSKIIEWLNILKQRPKMIIAASDIDYLILRIYVEAYLDGIGTLMNKNIGKEITEWFQKKINQKSSYYWTTHIPFYYEGKSDEELKKILLETTETFFNENPNWFKL
jgi:hypothetical protein